MKFVCVSCCKETLFGMRLAGIEGILAENSSDIATILENFKKDSSCAAILMTLDAINLNKDSVENFKLNQPNKLIFNIPDFYDCLNSAKNQNVK